MIKITHDPSAKNDVTIGIFKIVLYRFIDFCDEIYPKSKNHCICADRCSRYSKERQTAFSHYQNIFLIQYGCLDARWIYIPKTGRIRDKVCITFIQRTQSGW